MFFNLKENKITFHTDIYHQKENVRFYLTLSSAKKLGKPRVNRVQIISNETKIKLKYKGRIDNFPYRLVRRDANFHF